MMTRILLIFLLGLCWDARLLAQMGGMAAPTFTKDVAPILQKNCQTCHRPGEAAPFPLLSYEQARPWASSIKLVVQQKIMPPWYADPAYGHFANDRALTAKEISTLVAWANAGAPEGDPKDAPSPVNFVEGWGIPKPDKIFELPRAFAVPASGMVEYQYVIFPTGFTEDKWVQMAEARPFLVGYAPGQPAEILSPGQAKLIKAGSDIVLEVHYTPTGKATTDRTRVGIVFAKEPPKDRVLTLSASNGTFKIPPGDPNHRVDASFEVRRDVKLASLHPHMHMRGKDFEYRLVFPNGETRTILRVPAYNWRWQLWYNLAEPIALPKGTKIECTAHFDNSPNNPENPDPTKTIIWGQQNWDEMMVGFFNLVFDAKVPRQALLPQDEAAGAR